MDASLVLVAVTQGMVLGILAFDFYYRWIDRKERDALRAELKTAQAGLADLHNKSAGTLRDLQDKVSAHSVVLNARGR